MYKISLEHPDKPDNKQTAKKLMWILTEIIINKLERVLEEWEAAGNLFPSLGVALAESSGKIILEFWEYTESFQLPGEN